MQNVIHERVMDKRSGKNIPMGAYIGFRVGNKIITGWSRCNLKAGDKFDYHKGLEVALQNALSDKPLPAYDNEFCIFYELFRYRCQKFFKGCYLSNAKEVNIPQNIVDRYLPYFKNAGVTESEIRKYIEASVPLFDKLYAKGMHFPFIPPMNQDDLKDIFFNTILSQADTCNMGGIMGAKMIQVASKEEAMKIMGGILNGNVKLPNGATNGVMVQANSLEEAMRMVQESKGEVISKKLDLKPFGYVPPVHKNFHNIRGADGKFRRKSIMDIGITKDEMVTGQIVHRNTKNGRFCKAVNVKQGVFNI